MFALGASFAPCALRNSFSSYRCCTQMIVISNVPDTLYVSCPDVVGFFFFYPLVHLCWSDFSVGGRMTALQCEVFCSHNTQRISLWKNQFFVPANRSLSLPSQETVPQVMESAHIPKTHWPGLQVLAACSAPPWGAEPQLVLPALRFSSWICLGEKWGLEGVGIPSPTCGNVSSLVHRSKGVYPRAYSVPPTRCSSLLKY